MLNFEGILGLSVSLDFPIYLCTWFLNIIYMNKENNEKIGQEEQTNVKINLLSPEMVRMPKGTRETLSPLNFDIDTNGIVKKMDMTRSVPNLLMKVMGQKGLWMSFFNKKKEAFDTIRQPGSDVNFMLVVKTKDNSGTLAKLAFGMDSDEYIRTAGEGEKKVDGKFIECAREIHSYIADIFGKESLLLFRAVMGKASPRFFALVVPMDGNRVVPFKDMDLSKEGIQKTRDKLKNDISAIISSYQ